MDRTQSMAGICFGKGNWGRGHTGARGVWSCEVVGSLELDFEAWKKQNEPSSSAEIVLCMYLPIENTGILSKNSAGSKTGREIIPSINDNFLF